MKKLIFILLLLPCVAHSQHGVEAVFKNVKATDATLADSLNLDSGTLIFSNFKNQLYGFTEYHKISVGADQLSGLIADTLWIPNPQRATITFDSIRCTAGSDNQDFAFVRKNWAGGGVVVVATATASSDGNGMYYTTQTSFTTNTMNAGQFFGIVKPSGESEWETVEAYYHYTKQVF